MNRYNKIWGTAKIEGEEWLCKSVKLKFFSTYFSNKI